MGYSSDYANAIARIYSDLGRSQAEAKLQSGAAWGNAIQQIGQTVAGIPGQIAQEKSMAQQMKIVEANLARYARQEQDDEWLRSAMNSSVVDGKIDETRLTENLGLLGAAELVPQAVQTIRQSEAALQQLKNAQQQGQINEAELRKMALGYFLPFAQVIKESNFDPGVVNGALAAVGLQAGPEEAESLRAQFAADPKTLALMVEQVLVPQQAKPIEVGGVLLSGDMGPDGKPQILFDSRKAERETLQQALDAAILSGNGKEVSRLRNELLKNKAAERGPDAPAMPSFSRAEVTLSDGTTKIANYNAKTGKYTDVDTGAVLTGIGPASAGKGAPLSATAQDRLTGIQSSLSIMPQLEALFPGVESMLGPAEGRGRQMGQKIPGVPVNKDFARFDALSATLQNATIKAITGAQMSEPEAQRIARQIPMPTDKPEVWRQKFQATMENLRVMEQRILELSGNGGASAGLPRGAGPGGGGAAAAPRLTPEEYIKKYGGG